MNREETFKSSHLPRKKYNERAGGWNENLELGWWWGKGKEGYKLLQNFRLLKHYCPPSLVPHLHSSPPAFPFPPALFNCFGKTNNPKANTTNQKKKWTTNENNTPLIKLNEVVYNKWNAKQSSSKGYESKPLFHTTRANLVLTILEPKVYTVQQCQSIVLHPASIYCKSQ